jgi:hypothetical protein
VEAVRLLEHANAVSRPARLMANRKREGTFRAYDLDGSIREASFRDIYTADNARYETVFGSYYSI